MPLQIKKAGAYAAPLAVSVKKSGVYTAVVGVFAKVSGAYQSVLGAVSDSYMFASNLAVWPQGHFIATSGTQYRVDRTMHLSPPYETRSPRFCFSNMSVSTAFVETACSNTVLYQGVSVEIGGVRTPVTMNGGTAANLTLAADEYFWTDENSIVIPANTWYGVVVATYVPTSSYRPYAACTAPIAIGNGQVSGTTDQSALLVSGTITASASCLPVCPAYIVAKGWGTAGQPPVPLILGDSISIRGGDSDFEQQPDGVLQYLPKAINDSASSTRYAYGHVGAASTKALDFSAAKFIARKQAMLDVNGDYPFTCAISEYGINDSAGAVKTNFIGMAAYIKSIWPTKRFIQCTLTPRPTFTVANIGATTLGNQVSSYGSGAGSWADFHDYLMGQGAYSGLPANTDAVVNVRPAFESSAGSGIYPVPAFTTTVAATYSGASTISLAAAPAVGAALMGGVGDVGGAYKYIGIVASVAGAGPFTVTLYKSGAATALAVGAAVAAVEVDSLGIHPFTAGVNRARDIVITAKNSGVFS